jgi:hypothetical protein
LYTSVPEATGRPLSATFPAACGTDDDYEDDGYDVTTATADVALTTIRCNNAATVDRRNDGRGPDIVMSTATTLHMADTGTYLFMITLYPVGKSCCKIYF